MISLIISCIVLALLIVGGSAFVSGPKFHMNRMISRRLVLTPLKLTITDLHNGLFLEIDKTPFEIVEFQHVQPGRLSAFVRTKLRNVLKGTVQERTFRAGDRLVEATVEKTQAAYSYSVGDDVVFYDTKTSEELHFSKKALGNQFLFLSEGLQCGIITYKGQPVTLTLPINIQGAVSQIVEGQSTRKALMESGLEVVVPSFVKAGDSIIISTETNKYVGKA